MASAGQCLPTFECTSEDSSSTIRHMAQKVVVARDKARNTARITCRVCLEDFQTTINFLSEAVDVYNDWIDACETAN
ncbi:unnamed protein product [Timema podura]|uniref:Transcription elongation factor 1 homolog n=1 Tax=Timema podura TaxID=61482 RepID=A0ABN7NKC8_TIMPD|nr:unnamed protein product [Timema podura]